MRTTTKGFAFGNHHLFKGGRNFIRRFAVVYGRSIPCNGVECGGDDFTGGIESGGALLHAHGERIRGAFVLRETDDPAVRVFIVELGGAGLAHSE